MVSPTHSERKFNNREIGKMDNYLNEFGEDFIREVRDRNVIIEKQ